MTDDEFERMESAIEGFNNGHTEQQQADLERALDALGCEPAGCVPEGIERAVDALGLSSQIVDVDGLNRVTLTTQLVRNLSETLKAAGELAECRFIHTVEDGGKIRIEIVTADNQSRTFTLP